MLETEIWPNLYAESKRFGAALALVNARISTRTWQRYRANRWLFGPMLAFGRHRSASDAEGSRPL